MSGYQYILGVGVQKLVPNLHEKERYVIHCRSLQTYLSSGMQLRKVYRALLFEQSPWMDPYIRMELEKLQPPTLRKTCAN